MSLDEILYKIKSSGVYIEMEDRKKLGFNTYKTKNHGEILDIWNRGDNCMWDCQLFGYKNQIPYKTLFFTDNLVGYIFIPGGNHKILLKLDSQPNFSHEKFMNDMKRYIREYKKKSGIQGIKPILF